MLRNFDQYIGIELLNELFQISLKLKENYLKEVISNQSLIKGSLEDISFFNKDFLEFNFDEYQDQTSMILANCKTFPKHLMTEISKKIKDFRKGTILLTTTQTMYDFDNNWEIIDIVRKNMSWGTASIYIQIKIK